MTILLLDVPALKKFEDGIAEAKRVFVSKSYQRKGVSKQLMNLLEKQAKNQGYHTMILETGRRLKAANELYNSIGYSSISNYGVYVGIEKSICFAKKL